MKKLTRSEAAKFLKTHDNFCILSHRKPDGDTVGSSAALCRGLRQLGKRAYVLDNEEVTPRFRWLHEGLTKPEAEEGDTIVSVDVASPGMLPQAFVPLKDRISLRLDHHGTSTSFTEYETVDPDSASCAELVWDVLEELGVSMDEKIGEAVYVGASTDTGCFRFSNTNAHTFATAAKCAQAGTNIFELNQTLFDTNSLGRLQMQAWIVEHMQFLRSGKIAVCAIPRSVEEAIGVTEDDMDNMSSFPRTVAGVCMAATLRENQDGSVRLSVRSIPGYDAALVSQRFGGGGHVCAAGATLRLSLEEAARAVADVMLEQPV